MAGVRLFVGGLDYHMSDAELRALFRYYCGYGAILDAGVVPRSGCVNSGVGFITVRESYVARALALSGRAYNGHTLTVRRADTLGPRPPRRDQRTWLK